MSSLLNDPKLDILLKRLHANSDTQIQEVNNYFAKRRQKGTLDLEKPYDDELHLFLSDKMVARHPHVFGDDDRPSVESQNGLWEDIKARERAQKGEIKLLDGIARGLPPMLRALKLQKRAARVGFDWPEIDQVFDKMKEEAKELAVELASENKDQTRIQDEVGDLLFVAINLARKAGVDPETALQNCNLKFENRFNYVEEQVVLKHKNFNDVSLNTMEGYWQDAKAHDRK